MEKKYEKKNNNNVSVVTYKDKYSDEKILFSEIEIHKIENHNVKHLTESVQKFWNGNCCEIELINSNNIDEVILILKELLTTD